MVERVLIAEDVFTSGEIVHWPCVAEQKEVYELIE